MPFHLLQYCSHFCHPDAEVCNQRLCLLCQLKKMNMSCDCLMVVVHAIILLKLFYTSSARYGFISVEQLNTVKKILTEAYKWGLNGSLYCATELLRECDCRLFKATCNLSLSQCLRHLLPAVRKVRYVLRDWGDPYELTEDKSHKTKWLYCVVCFWLRIMLLPLVPFYDHYSGQTLSVGMSN